MSTTKTPSKESPREGSLEAPTRHALDWQGDAFNDEAECMKELARVYDICHGCRRCVNLCEAFPKLFDLIDESPSMELDGVDEKDYSLVVDDCYLCDLCYQTKCPYVPPHEWNVDFPHLMLRAKAIRFKKQGARARDRMLSATDSVGKLASIPFVDATVNAANNNKLMRKCLESVLDIDAEAPLPRYHSKHLRKRLKNKLSNKNGKQDQPATEAQAQAAGSTRGKVMLFATCYGNYNKPEIGEDLVAVLEHNGIPVQLIAQERCCGMPKMELGDLEAVDKLRRFNLPALAEAVEQGWDIVAPVPSCVLMFKQELPLMFPEDEQVKQVSQHIFDTFEYLHLRHKAGLLNTDFKGAQIGKLAYQVACHQRVQNIGMKTRDILALIPGTEITPIEHCSGHDGSYAVKKESRGKSLKIARRVTRKLESAQADHYTSDCPMAATHIAHIKDPDYEPPHPVSLLRRAYAI